MPRRHTRRRKAPDKMFEWETANLRARVAHLFSLAGKDETAREVAFEYYSIPDAYEREEKDPREEIAYVLSEEYAEMQRDREASLRRLEEHFRPAEETGRTPPPRHDAHAPLNSPTPDGSPEAPEPSPGNSAEAPPRPRVLYL